MLMRIVRLELDSGSQRWVEEEKTGSFRVEDLCDSRARGLRILAF